MKKIYLILLLAAISLNLLCQVHWTKYQDNPVMVPGASGEWDETRINARSVLYFDSAYHMWYTSGELPSIGYSTSPDGINWTKHPGNPVLTPGQSGSWEENLVAAPNVLIQDNVFHMWYIGQSGDTYNLGFRVGHATSPDGINWTKDPTNPVLSEGPNGSWDDAWVGNGAVLYINSVFHIWYAGWDGVGDLLTGHATSSDGVSWTKDPNNPVLATGSWDYSRCEPGPVIFDGSTFHQWYHGGPFQLCRVGYATSEDGSYWTKDPDNPILDVGTSEEWDSKYLSAGAVIYDSAENKYKMWYNGNSASGKASIGYAETYEPAWKQMESMDIERGNPSSTEIDQMIYVFGGMDKNFATLSSARAYNSITNEWSELENMPKDLFGGPAAAINGKIYVVGGYSHSGGDWIPSNSTLEYDPDGDVWQTKSNSPEPKAGMSSCVLGDTLYILGGNSENEKEAWSYVPETDSWGILPDMIYERPAGSSAVTIDNLIYVTGGTFESGLENPTGKSEVYDPQSQVWTELADMPVQIKNHISVVHDQKILVFGGDSTRTEGGASIGTNFIQAYDPSTDSWKIMKGMPFKRAGMGGGKVDGYVYLIGGYLNSMQNPPLSELWSFNLDSLKEWVVPCNEVLISQSSLTMTKGDTHSLSASVLPTYSSDRTVSWSSSDEGIVTVSADGVVSGISLGEATITATANAGECSATCLVIVGPVGIEKDKAGHFALFPNPVNDLLTVQTGITESHLVEISSINGKVLYSRIMDWPGNQIDLSSFQKGVYFITIRSEDFVATRKIVKL